MGFSATIHVRIPHFKEDVLIDVNWQGVQSIFTISVPGSRYQDFQWLQQSILALDLAWAARGTVLSQGTQAHRYLCLLHLFQKSVARIAFQKIIPAFTFQPQAPLRNCRGRGICLRGGGKLCRQNSAVTLQGALGEQRVCCRVPVTGESQREAAFSRHKVGLLFCHWSNSPWFIKSFCVVAEESIFQRHHGAACINKCTFTQGHYSL